MSPISKEPYLINFDKIGDKSIGYIVTTQKADFLPFMVRRIFWTVGTPVGVQRGGHANKTMQELLVAVQGNIQVTLKTKKNKEYSFILDSPAKGLYVPPFCWITIDFEEDSVLLSLASTDFNEADYIREYTNFCALLS
jgi:hypothetical protein